MTAFEAINKPVMVVNPVVKTKCLYVDKQAFNNMLSPKKNLIWKNRLQHIIFETKFGSNTNDHFLAKGYDL